MQPVPPLITMSSILSETLIASETGPAAAAMTRLASDLLLDRIDQSAAAPLSDKGFVQCRNAVAVGCENDAAVAACERAASR